MKNRFLTGKKYSDFRSLLFSICLFAAVILAFTYGVSSLSSRTEEEELETLERALTRGITYCYAVEGSYPKNLTYLKENYGLIYNEDKYFIDYQPLGANIMPDVTIIRKTED